MPKANDTPALQIGHLGSLLVDIERDQTAIARAVRLVRKEPTDDDLQWLRDGFGAWLRASLDVPLERCLRLPRSLEGARVESRDRWLRAAAAELQGDTVWSRAESLQSAWDAFLARGPWRVWRDEEDPPADAPRLYRALFLASRLNRGTSIGKKQLARILGHRNGEQCPQ